MDFAPAQQHGSAKTKLGVCVLLAVVTLIVFWPVHDFGFTHYDDENYVSQNSIVKQGLSLRGTWWAFTRAYFSYWHPLTWLSHMLDVALFGLNGGAHHLMSVALHIVNTIVLFRMLDWMTRSWVKSAFVAALFAWHPTHVESVAWIAERKDVLSGFFWILTCWAYAWYAENRQLRRYLLALLLFACGLMSKPMVVTLPCVLVLLDWWPLGRMPWVRGTGLRSYEPISLKHLTLEKVPFFAGTLLSVAITYIGVRRAGSIVSEEIFPIELRWANVPISYVRYLGKLFWPENLAVLYPMPESWPGWMVAGSSVLLILLTIGFLLLAKRFPYLISGWLWYLGPLVPTIGIIPVGWQSMADRYTYLPFIGLFWMIVWGANELLRRRSMRVMAGVMAVVALAACAWTSRAQVWVWKDTETLFTHAARVTDGNFIAHYNVGMTRALAGDSRSARRHFEEAVRINPRYDQARNNLGVLLLKAGEYALATNEFRAALRLQPQNTIARVNLARALIMLGDCPAARAQLDPLLRQHPNSGEVLHLIGVCLAVAGKLSEAQGHFEAALSHNPTLEEARIGMARAMLGRGKGADALTLLQTAHQSNPASPKIARELAWVQAHSGDFEDARKTAEGALRLANSARESLRQSLKEMIRRLDSQDGVWKEPVAFTELAVNF